MVPGGVLAERMLGRAACRRHEAGPAGSDRFAGGPWLAAVASEGCVQVYGCAVEVTELCVSLSQKASQGSLSRW